MWEDYEGVAWKWKAVRGCHAVLGRERVEQKQY